MSHPVTDLDQEIWAVLRKGDPLSTAQLAEELGADRKTVYQRVKRMEPFLKKKKWMTSKLESNGRRLYFFPTTGNVLTNTSFPRIQQTIDELKAIARRKGVPPGKQLSKTVKAELTGDYRAYLNGLTKGCTDREERQLKAFQSQLEVVLGGTTISDVIGFFGLRPFSLKERVWTVLPGGPTVLPDDLDDL